MLVMSQLRLVNFTCPIVSVTVHTMELQQKVEVGQIYIKSILRGQLYHMGKPIKELEAASMTSKSCTISMNTYIPQLETNSFPVAVYVPQ